jgi:hypothetical protein
MKKTPRMQKIEEMLHSSQIVSGGFLGNDRRELDEIIARDTAEVEASGLTCEELADRMQAVTDAAIQGLGMEVSLPDGKRAFVDEVKGLLICPWPDDDFRCDKRVTTLEDPATGEIIHWTDLNIHLIRQHRFFEGRGSPFRMEPAALIRMLT